MKIVTTSRLKTFLTNVRALLKPSVTNYYLQITSGVTYTIPSYNANKSVVEVYINGLRAVEGTDYKISSAGVISLVNSVASGNYLYVVHSLYN